ncbi:hypothetical protein M2263_004167 [Providencia alcalifaciens]|nr:hypothetical protein [Providencia alcalifaciens]
MERQDYIDALKTLKLSTMAEALTVKPCKMS